MDQLISIKIWQLAIMIKKIESVPFHKYENSSWLIQAKIMKKNPR